MQPLRIIALASCLFFLIFQTAALAESPAPPGDDPSRTYSQQEIRDAVEGFFAGTTRGLAEILERIFADYGRPNGYIQGEEAGGALVVGLRYGQGHLHLKGQEPVQLYWQGPSVGFDLGGHVAKNFTLVYNLTDPELIFQRFPGVDGSAYVVGGVSMNYQKSNEIILAPIRTGVGLRLGANIGYLHYTRQQHINPF